MKKWFVINTYSGHENKVRTTLERRVESLGVGRHFGDIRIPMESVIEIKDGKKVPVEQRQFPGYILVNMDMNENTWQIVRQTPGVTQIVGNGDTPLPLSRGEVERLEHRATVTTCAGPISRRRPNASALRSQAARLAKAHTCTRGFDKRGFSLSSRQELMQQVLVWLSPLSGDAGPSGPNLEYDNAFLELTKAAEGKPETQFERAVPPDWRAVRWMVEDLFERSDRFSALHLGDAAGAANVRDQQLEARAPVAAMTQEGPKVGAGRVVGHGHVSLRSARNAPPAA